MKLSTRIVLSILSANVFAIGHPNGAHYGSLLARRAVVADTDGFSLHKRTNDEDKEEQAKPKVSPISNFGKEKHAYDNPTFENYPHSDPNPSDDTKEGTTDSPTYFFDQDRGAKDERKTVHTSLVSNQGGTKFADSSRDSSLQVLDHIRKELSHVKLGFELFYSIERALAAAEEVWYHFGGEKSGRIEWHVYIMLEYALETSHNYRILYEDPARSPFSLELPSTISNKSKKTYMRLQDEALKSIENHITAINSAVEHIFLEPNGVLPELERMMKNIESFSISILDMRYEYSRLLSPLKTSGSGHLANLDTHMNLLGVYKYTLYGRLNIIKKMLGDYRESSKKEDSSKSSSPTLKPKGRPEVESKPSEDLASSSTQSNVAVVGDLISFD
ncbi:hypothetical protein BASA60_003311 [Batrachochytrium salamandrivorans]|nr:hypothetical protein BASA62_009674 [Batrachochytrium salamandrivorans]KAH6579354.1 hypothetical protein BASA60_003311 [Batrachochytrium salamandrivorans]KAH9273032.1 hypothetical protein BASA83_004601 [Batrachochytrium salamandrivorans]